MSRIGRRKNLRTNKWEELKVEELKTLKSQLTLN